MELPQSCTKQPRTHWAAWWRCLEHYNEDDNCDNKKAPHCSANYFVIIFAADVIAAGGDGVVAAAADDDDVVAWRSW